MLPPFDHDAAAGDIERHVGEPGGLLGEQERRHHGALDHGMRDHVTQR
jgi:hypothetical protein